MKLRNYLSEKSEKIIHVYKEQNGSFRIEDNHDDVLQDSFKTADEAYAYAKKHYKGDTIYKYKGK